MPCLHKSHGLGCCVIRCKSISIFPDILIWQSVWAGCFGFRFLENFNFPYAAKSITDFWRRWHISLSTWFRDYVYIPLGGNRKGKSRTYVNLVIVFFLTGLWHGASWHFVAWGMFHGFFLVLEKIRGVKTELIRGRRGIAKTIAAYASQGITMLIVIVGWVPFRAESLSDAAMYLGRMFFITSAEAPRYAVSYYINSKLLLVLVIAAFAAFGVFGNIKRHVYSKVKTPLGSILYPISV